MTQLARRAKAGDRQAQWRNKDRQRGDRGLSEQRGFRYYCPLPSRHQEPAAHHPTVRAGLVDRARHGAHACQSARCCDPGKLHPGWRVRPQGVQPVGTARRWVRRAKEAFRFTCFGSGVPGGQALGRARRPVMLLIRQSCGTSARLTPRRSWWHRVTSKLAIGSPHPPITIENLGQLWEAGYDVEHLPNSAELNRDATTRPPPPKGGRRPRPRREAGQRIPGMVPAHRALVHPPTALCRHCGQWRHSLTRTLATGSAMHSSSPSMKVDRRPDASDSCSSA